MKHSKKIKRLSKFENVSHTVELVLYEYKFICYQFEAFYDLLDTYNSLRYYLSTKEYSQMYCGTKDIYTV